MTDRCVCFGAPVPEPTAEDRLTALEAAMLELIMGGAE